MAETARPTARLYFPVLCYGSLPCECAYVDGFPVSTEDPDMATLKTFATNGNISFARATSLVGWMSGV